MPFSKGISPKVNTTARRELKLTNVLDSDIVVTTPRRLSTPLSIFNLLISGWSLFCNLLYTYENTKMHVPRKG